MILAFNRPSLFRECLDAIAGKIDCKIYIHVDGPRKIKKQFDSNKIQMIKQIIDEYENKFTIKTYFQNANLGIRHSVPFAINWVLNENDSIIVVEDDLIPSVHALNFCMNSLVLYRENPYIGCVAGYSNSNLDFGKRDDSDVHLSIFPESYMWATWRHKWAYYSDTIYLKNSLKKLSKFLDIRDWKFMLIWQIRAWQARWNIVDTWAYRWVFSLWQQKMFCVIPNHRISVYKGNDEGTHTLGFKKQNLVTHQFYPIVRMDISTNDYDKSGDLLLARKIFGMSNLGILLLIGETIVLMILKVKRQIHKRLRY